ncbi:hypothetical protein ENUP19_0060G0038 [Entamoeba nuttalli]|uniref:Ubiquitin-like protease family profile domain-containing protein n=1 Tax=Entamoeba nuttalli TaxID=412467 RepID=A0ABQ0DDF3_9EUKA
MTNPYDSYIQQILELKHQLDEQSKFVEEEYFESFNQIKEIASAIGFEDDKPIQPYQVGYQLSHRDIIMPSLPKEFSNAIDELKRGKCSSQIGISELLKSLRTEWLGDEVVNGFIELLQNKRIGFLNSFFFTKLSKNWSLSGNRIDYENSKRWVKNNDLFSYEKVLIPVNISNTHWVLCVIDNDEHTISVYDSLSGGRSCQNISLKIAAFVRRLADETGHLGIYNIIDIDDNPKQSNGYDCGAFTCKCADCISLGVPLEFTQKDMPKWRELLVAQVIVGKLIVPRD